MDSISLSCSSSSGLCVLSCHLSVVLHCFHQLHSTKRQHNSGEKCCGEKTPSQTLPLHSCIISALLFYFLLLSWVMKMICSSEADIFIFSSSRSLVTWHQCCFWLTSSSLWRAMVSPLITRVPRQSWVMAAWWCLHQRQRGWTQHECDILLLMCVFVHCALRSHYFLHCSSNMTQGAGLTWYPFIQSLNPVCQTPDCQINVTYNDVVMWAPSCPIKDL